MEIFAALRRAPLAALLGVVLALAAVGGGHRMAPPASDPALAAFLAAGGTVADLCLDGGGHGLGDGPGDAARHCDACQPTLAGPLPAPARTLTRAAARPARSVQPGRAPARARARRRAWAPRAPPAG